MANYLVTIAIILGSCYCTKLLFAPNINDVTIKCAPALPLLGLSPNILGFSIQPWVLFFYEDLGFFLGFFKFMVFLGVFDISPKNTFFPEVFAQK